VLGCACDHRCDCTALLLHPIFEYGIYAINLTTYTIKGEKVDRKSNLNTRISRGTRKEK
jgi:hypothetical protein